LEFSKSNFNLTINCNNLRAIIDNVQVQFPGELIRESIPYTETGQYPFENGALHFFSINLLFIKSYTKVKIVYHYSKSSEASIKFNTSFHLATKRRKGCTCTSLEVVESTAAFAALVNKLNKVNAEHGKELKLNN